MTNGLHRLFEDLADDMTGTDYVALRNQVQTSARRIGRRRTTAVAFAGAVAVAAVAVGGYALVGNPAASPQPLAPSTFTTSPTSPASPSPAAVPTAVPGTLMYLSVRAGQPIIMTTVTNGVARETRFGMPTPSDVYLARPGGFLTPSPDGTRLAAIDSPDPGIIQPGDLVIIEPGGARRTIATGVRWGGGNVPVWMPDGRHIIATIGDKSSVIDVETGQTTAARPAEGNANYLAWSANGKWRAYSAENEVVVTAADGSGEVRKSVAFLSECHERPGGCPTSVQAVSDDGRYVALGSASTDPTHVAEAHLALDMRTGKTVSMPKPPADGRIDEIQFRPDGGMIVRTATSDHKFNFVLLGSDGSTIATFPDTYRQHPDGRNLVAYRP